MISWFIYPLTDSVRHLNLIYFKITVGLSFFNNVDVTVFIKCFHQKIKLSHKRVICAVICPFSSKFFIWAKLASEINRIQYIFIIGSFNEIILDRLGKRDNSDTCSTRNDQINCSANQLIQEPWNLLVLLQNLNSKCNDVMLLHT